MPLEENENEVIRSISVAHLVDIVFSVHFALVCAYSCFYSFHSSLYDSIVGISIVTARSFDRLVPISAALLLLRCTNAPSIDNFSRAN